MAKAVHPILGAIDTSAPGFWDATIAFGGRTVTVDLTIDSSDVSAALIEDLPQTSNDLEPLDRIARVEILRDAQSGDDDAAAALYLTHHRDVLPPGEFQRLFGTADPDPANAEALLSRLVLVRVGFYPENEKSRVLFDYSIDSEATNYLLCVSFDSRGQPTAVDLES